MSGSGAKAPLPDMTESLFRNVCHESTVGLSAKFSTASAFSTPPVLHDYYTILKKQIVEEFMTENEIIYDAYTTNAALSGGIWITYWSGRSDTAEPA